MTRLANTVRNTRRRVARMLVKIDRSVPVGLRAPIGVLLVVGGIFGFLPILGFWMIPLGIAVIGLDVHAFQKRSRQRDEDQRRNRSKDLR